MENSINSIYSTRSRADVINLGGLSNNIINLSGTTRQLLKGIENDVSSYDFGGLLLSIGSTIDKRYSEVAGGKKYIETSLGESYLNHRSSKLLNNPDKDYCTNLLSNLGKETIKAQNDINKLPESAKRETKSEDVYAQIVDSNNDLKLSFSSTIKALSYNGASKVFVAGKDADAQGKADIEFLDSSNNTILKRDAKCFTSLKQITNSILKTSEDQLNFKGNFFAQYKPDSEFPTERLINGFIKHKNVLLSPCKYKDISLTFVDTKGVLLYNGFPINRSECP